MAVAAPRWTRLERDERREQILSAARRLFSERRFDAVSTSEVALEAGVTRGLVHHYFGTKRGLYLEVVRSMLAAAPDADPTNGTETAIEEGLDRWLEMVRRNRGTWLAAVGAQGLGRDPEVEAIVDTAREAAVDRLIEGLELGEAQKASPQVRASLRAYSGLAEAASIEWIERRRFSKDEIREFLLRSLQQIVNVALPAVERAGANGTSTRKRRTSA
jgi:AcrR family transcriptional regulator